MLVDESVSDTGLAGAALFDLAGRAPGTPGQPGDRHRKERSSPLGRPTDSGHPPVVTGWQRMHRTFHLQRLTGHASTPISLTTSGLSANGTCAHSRQLVGVRPMVHLF